ncbi:MAG TPA: zf-HC2 domain-containing protein [Polyangia bacterium]|nr:zf-HC2 domain-containing protein [Polyangia bacterium]
MATDCEQTRSLMLELLYGELSATARAEVQAHVSGCPGCQTELAALESTRSLARQTLAADAPPARAHAAIMRAAAAAVPVLRTPAPARLSLWSRLKGKWTLPTLATVGAVAVFLLASRIFLEPEKTYERGRQGLAPPAEAPATAPAALAPAQASQPAAQAGARAKHEALEPAVESNAHLAAPARAHRHPVAATASSGKGGLAAPRRSMDDLLDDEVRSAPAARAFSPPPAPADKPERKPAKKGFVDPFGGLGAAESERDRAGGAPAAKAEAPPAPVMASPPPAAAPAPARSAPASRHETLAARADRLFAEQRWVEAAAAYRDLLRSDPGNPAAAQWRQRLDTCRSAGSIEAK